MFPFLQQDIRYPQDTPEWNFSTWIAVLSSLVICFCMAVIIYDTFKRFHETKNKITWRDWVVLGFCLCIGLRDQSTVTLIVERGSTTATPYVLGIRCILTLAAIALMIAVITDEEIPTHMRRLRVTDHPDKIIDARKGLGK